MYLNSLNWEQSNIEDGMIKKETNNLYYFATST